MSHYSPCIFLCLMYRMYYYAQHHERTIKAIDYLDYRYISQSLSYGDGIVTCIMYCSITEHIFDHHNNDQYDFFTSVLEEPLYCHKSFGGSKNGELGHMEMEGRGEGKVTWSNIDS